MNQITLFKRANAQVSRSAFLPLKMAGFSSTKRISDGGNSSTDLTTPNKSELNLKYILLVSLLLTTVQHPINHF